MLHAIEPLLLDGGDDPAVAEENGGAIMLGEAR